MRALLRRANIEIERKITIGNLILDADGMSAEIDGEEISLTTREFNIIYKLLSYPKKLFQGRSSWMNFGVWTPAGSGCLCDKIKGEIINL